MQTRCLVAGLATSLAVAALVTVLPSGIGCVSADRQLLKDIQRHPEDCH